jgi:hypothetical protein
MLSLEAMSQAAQYYECVAMMSFARLQASPGRVLLARKDLTLIAEEVV